MTNNDDVADLCRSLRVHGKGASKYENVRICVNSRLDTLQAAVLLVKLKKLREYEMDARQRIAMRYTEAFEGSFKIIKIADGCVSAYAQYTLLAENSEKRGSRYSKSRNKQNTAAYA